MCVVSDGGSCVDGVIDTFGLNGVGRPGVFMWQARGFCISLKDCINPGRMVCDLPVCGEPAVAAKKGGGEQVVWIERLPVLDLHRHDLLHRGRPALACLRI